MQRGKCSIHHDVAVPDTWDRYAPESDLNTVELMDAGPSSTAWPMGSPQHDDWLQDGHLAAGMNDDSPGEGTYRGGASINVAEFVERVFIPEHVMRKRTAGRAHFQAMLKHILSPERAAQAFQRGGKPRVRLMAHPSWPYLDDVRISDVRREHVERLIKASINRGYSAQMVTHLRNVIRHIFSYASARGYFPGPNPAMLVTVPSIAHKTVPALTLSQLKQTFDLMRYPEQQIALFALLTDMNVTETCGLKWKYVNLSNNRYYVSGELLPARSIAVKMQRYRGEDLVVVGRRNRLVQIPELLHSALQQLKHRIQYTSNEDFVLVSRRGTPINPDNVALRRLKWIARVLDMEGLSWKVFHRTGVELQAQFGNQMNKELERVLTLKAS